LVENPFKSFFGLDKHCEQFFRGDITDVATSRKIRVHDGNAKHALLRIGAGFHFTMGWTSNPASAEHDVYSMQACSMADKDEQVINLISRENIFIVVHDHIDGVNDSSLTQGISMNQVFECITNPVTLTPEACEKWLHSQLSIICASFMCNAFHHILNGAHTT